MIDIPLRIYNGEPTTSLFGTMFFPADAAKAEHCASWLLAQTVASRGDADTVRALPEHELLTLLARACRSHEIADEAKKACFAGTQAGAMVSYLWHALRTGVPASWEDAQIGATILGSRHGVAAARGPLFEAKKQFGPVLHFWAVLSLECGNRWPHDIRLFISQATILLREMRAAEKCGAIKGESFRSQKIYVPVAALDWREAGTIRVGALPDYLLPAGKKHAGRPTKIPVRR